MRQMKNGSCILYTFLFFIEILRFSKVSLGLKTNSLRNFCIFCTSFCCSFAELIKLYKSKVELSEAGFVY